ncbi:MAG TPA: hypothetical protein VF199_08600, partial [Bacillales bacterium]
MAQTLRSQLLIWEARGTVLEAVYVERTQHDDEPDLFGVTVQEVGGNFVVFNQAGSGGIGNIYVRIDQIVAIDA